MTTPLSERVTAGPVTIPANTNRTNGTAGVDGITWRAANLADVPAIAGLEFAMAQLDHPNFSITEAELVEELESSTCDPSQDSLVGFDSVTGRMIAYGFVMMPPGAETEVRVQLYFGGIHPEFRGRGLGRQLLAWQESRALERLAGLDSDLPARITMASDERAPREARLAERFGFVASRWFVWQERDLAKIIPSIGLEHGLRIIPFSDEWSERTRVAKNDAFRDHWGSQPTSQESWEALRSLPTFSSAHSFLAVSDGGEVAGLVITEVNEGDWALQGFSSGYVDLLGVPRAWRNRRIAPALLARAFESYRAAGFEKAVLNVDSDNPTGAFGLYARMGFVSTTSRVTYQKAF